MNDIVALRDLAGLLGRVWLSSRWSEWHCQSMQGRKRQP